MTRIWMKMSSLDLEPWEHRLCVAVELDERTLLYITDGGHIHVQKFDNEKIYMSAGWERMEGGEW